MTTTDKSLAYLYGKADPPADESEDPVIALQQSLDKHGKFEMDDQGLMIDEHHKVFNACIVRQTMRLLKIKTAE